MVEIIPSLWLNNNFDEMVAFYQTVFDSVEISDVLRAGPGGPGPEGTVIAGSISIDGNKFVGVNGGAGHPFTDAISFTIRCKDQAEVDRYWNGLTADGGTEVQCGWCKDKFGLSWQVVPDAMFHTINGPDAAGRGRAMAAMMKMKKLDVAGLEAAYAGR